MFQVLFYPGISICRRLIQASQKTGLNIQAIRSRLNAQIKPAE
jgi:hypothetical protein